MINITEHQHLIVQDILRRSLHDCEVLAFGSRLSTSNKKSSDLDLAIIGHQGFSLLQLYELREKFSESELHFELISSIGMPSLRNFEKLFRLDVKNFNSQ